MNSSIWGRTWKALYHFLAQDQVSGFRGADIQYIYISILISTASHVTANRSSGSFRSWSEEANRTALPPKSRDAILRPPRRNASTAPTHSVCKRYEQNLLQWQPWRSSTLSGNESDLLTARQPKLWSCNDSPCQGGLVPHVPKVLHKVQLFLQV